MGKIYLTNEVIEIVGISKSTLYNWLRAGKVPEAFRDRNNHRFFTEADVQRLKDYKNLTKKPMRSFLVEQEVAKTQNNV
jgi:DNA-binding transcriptional MerR regulator